MKRYAHLHSSPIGNLLTIVDAEGRLERLSFAHDRDREEALAAEPGGAAGITWDRAANRAVADQLAAYFAGERPSFDLPLAPRGGPFDLRVWKRLLKIPFGATRTYGEVATQVGRPGAARAVGGAVGRNPIAIVIPCHRVIGANGSLTGFGGGLATKRYLLELEGVLEREPALFEH